MERKSDTLCSWGYWYSCIKMGVICPGRPPPKLWWPSAALQIYKYFTQILQIFAQQIRAFMICKTVINYLQNKNNILQKQKNYEWNE